MKYGLIVLQLARMVNSLAACSWPSRFE